MNFVGKKNAKLLQDIPAGNQNIKKILNLLLSYLVYSQIWLNLFVDDHEFDRIIICLEKKTHLKLI
jgi:hypothetical protein